MISIVGDGTGTYSVQLKSPISATITGGTFTLSERSDVPGEYFVTPTGAVAGDYRLVFFKNGAYYATGPDLYPWDGTQEVTLRILLAAGSAASVATAVRTNLDSDLITIKAQGKLAAARVTNRIKIDPFLNREILYDTNGTTILVQKNLKGVDGAPASDKIYEAVP